jgi:hypothetical protein
METETTITLTTDQEQYLVDVLAWYNEIHEVLEHKGKVSKFHLTCLGTYLLVLGAFGGNNEESEGVVNHHLFPFYFFWYQQALGAVANQSPATVKNAMARNQAILVWPKREAGAEYPDFTKFTASTVAESTETVQ